MLAKTAYSFLNHEKPHSSITDWVEILTSSNVEDEAYDGVPELVEVINLQPTGPGEASRALRKKLKHGTPHQQYRALVILKALVENGGHKFQTTFADSQLTDALKNLASDSSTDPKVKRKLLNVLASWKNQFQGDSSMQFVANLYGQCRPTTHVTRTVDPDAVLADQEYEKRKREEKERKEDAKRKAREDKEKERLKREEDAKKAKQKKTKRQPFDFEKEKPLVLSSIANASQASSNLVNAITLVNTEHDSLPSNERVQDCLATAKHARKQIVRYIQLVENEELIGTLIETNDRIIGAIEMYDTLSKSTVTEQDVSDVQKGVAAMNMKDPGELNKLQEKQRAAVERAKGTGRGKERAEETDTYVHPDLHDLSFGPLGAEQRGLPPPLRPSGPMDNSDDEVRGRGSLSDFSDYESSDEEEHKKRAAGSSSSQRRPYGDLDQEDVDVRRDPKRGLLIHNDASEDPFADPFADPEHDSISVGTPGIADKKGMDW
ncbi:hypothetical protein JAAARDRAFT_120204 [Jaapia argillacea MUCL 33604]|uniref:VHS domain-containing protein n=1 Tax=Jaapia argillacea MUCL 33604 TaxID=933084 RepID=A0A067QL26_9AGAM|nr:hypothetical protein JAAARDRAFT_120204 [Jaapia argillacea MUCL 33604]